VRTVLLIPIHDYWSMECNDDSQIRWNACCLNNATQDSGRAQWNYYYLWADSMSKCIIVGEMQLWIAASLCGKVSIGGNITRPKKKPLDYNRCWMHILLQIGGLYVWENHAKKTFWCTLDEEIASIQDERLGALLCLLVRMPTECRPILSRYDSAIIPF
jgi:hypothetical protein